MKWYKYKTAKEEPVGEETRLVLSDVMKQATPETFEIAKREAYNGEYEIEDDGQPEPEEEAATGPSQDDIGRLMVMVAQDVPGEVALSVQSMYNVWEAGKRYGYDGCEKIVKVPNMSPNFGDPYLLYRCIQPHTSQADWKPVDTPALWVRINKSNAGTKDDPIPAARSMEYEYGLYYSDPEDGKIYLCTRTGEQEGTKVVLHYLPHELAGHYFKEVSE